MQSDNYKAAQKATNRMWKSLMDGADAIRVAGVEYKFDSGAWSVLGTSPAAPAEQRPDRVIKMLHRHAPTAAILVIYESGREEAWVLVDDSWTYTDSAGEEAKANSYFGNCANVPPVPEGRLPTLAQAVILPDAETATLNGEYTADQLRDIANTLKQ